MNQIDTEWRSWRIQRDLSNVVESKDIEIKNRSP